MTASLLEFVNEAVEHNRELIGRHQFTAYLGDMRYEPDSQSGLLVPVNEIVYESPVYENLIVTVGKESYLDRLAGLGSVGAFGHIGVGNSNQAPALGDIGLVGASNLIQACDATFPSRAALVLTFKSTYGTGVANFNWQEAVIANGTVNNTAKIFNRVLIGPFTKSSAVSIAYSTTITQS